MNKELNDKLQKKKDQVDSDSKTLLEDIDKQMKLIEALLKELK